MSRVGTTQGTSSEASAQGVKRPLQIEVLSANDPRGQNARNATPESADPNYNRQTAQNFSRTSNTTNQTQTNSAQDSNEPPGKNAFENMIGRGRTAVDKIGTALMWGAGGLAGLLYLGLGWKKLAMVIGGLGVGAGYFLKTKLAKVGEEADHHQQVVNAIKAMKLPKELEKEIFEFLNQKLSASAYQNPQGQGFAGTAKDIFTNAANAAQNFAQGQASRFNNQPASSAT
ncbi:MAG: hypothetical protein ACKO3R_07460 [bacterium]